MLCSGRVHFDPKNQSFKGHWNWIAFNIDTRSLLIKSTYCFYEWTNTENDDYFFSKLWLIRSIRLQNVRVNFISLILNEFISFHINIFSLLHCICSGKRCFSLGSTHVFAASRYKYEKLRMQIINWNQSKSGIMSAEYRSNCCCCPCSLLIERKSFYTRVICHFHIEIMCSCSFLQTKWRWIVFFS